MEVLARGDGDSLPLRLHRDLRDHPGSGGPETEGRGLRWRRESTTRGPLWWGKTHPTGGQFLVNWIAPIKTR